MSSKESQEDPWFDRWSPRQKGGCKMKRSIGGSLVGLFLAGLAAGCTGSAGQTGSSSSGGNNGGPGSGGKTAGSGGSPVNPGTGGSPSNPGSGGSNNPGSGGSDGSGSGGAPSTLSCVKGIPATSQVPRMTQRQYDTVVTDLLGLTSLSSAGNGPPSSLLGADSSGPVDDIAWNGYLSAAEKIATQVIASSSKSKFISCSDATDATCLTNTIKTFGRKAFRRPVTDAEVASLMRFNSLTPKGTSDQVAESVLFAILASPSFISLPELGQTKDGSALKLTSYEVATRLSFLIWNSIPDDTLNTEADADRLQSGDQIRAQALRMLQSPKAAGIASTFHRTYANISNGTHWTNNNVHSIGGYTSATYTDAMAELDAFFADVVVGGGTFADLFNSPAAFVTKNTASIYGVSSTATTPTKMMLDGTKRPGFLSRVGFLSTFAHDTQSSPILRGAFITQVVLAIPVGDPDPKFLSMTPPAADYKTNRDATTALTMGSPCNGCHTFKVNPPGFVLERYDAVGAWQDKDPLGGDINSTADVILSTIPAVTKTLSSPAELMAEIGKAPNAQRSYAEKFVSFATGRSPNQNDACIVDQLSTNMAGSGYSVASMMADYTQADSFRLRTLGN